MLVYDCLTVEGKINCFNARIDKNVGILGQRDSGKEEIVKATFRLSKAKGRISLDDVNILQLGIEEFREILWKKISWLKYNHYEMFNPIYDIASHFVEIVVSHSIGNADYAIDLAKEALRLVGEKEEVLTMYPNQLSPLRLKKVALALSIFTEPDYVFIEDIEYGLSELGRIYIVNSLIDVMNVLNSKFIVLDNDPAVLSRLSDYFYVIYKGYIVEEGTDVIRNPYHPYTIDLISGEIEGTNVIGKGCVYSSRCRFKSIKCENSEPNTFKYENGVVKCNLYPWKSQ
jgi:peptide/nickel transport system ATP-binding protein